MRILVKMQVNPAFVQKLRDAVNDEQHDLGKYSMLSDEAAAVVSGPLGEAISSQLYEISVQEESHKRILEKIIQELRS